MGKPVCCKGATFEIGPQSVAFYEPMLRREQLPDGSVRVWTDMVVARYVWSYVLQEWVRIGWWSLVDHAVESGVPVDHGP